MALLQEDSVKTALLGAAIGAGLGFVLGRDVLRWGLVGGGAGLAKSFFLPADGERHLAGYLVGAPPPGRDYSFTRRPGFNDKNY